MLLRFLANAGPVVYITPLNLFKIGSFNISNSIFYGWISCLVVVIFLILIARRIKIRPVGRLTDAVEGIAEYMSNLVVSNFEDKERGKKYVPYFVTLFFFLLLNNWLGLIPGVGSALVYHGHPFLRPFTGDFNATLAAGVVTMIHVYYSSVKEAGVRDYFKHFFVGNPLNPLYLIIGVIEMITDLTRVVSLSIRLFLNISIGDILIAVFVYLGSVFAPITATPFTLLAIFVGALQAYIFVVLSVAYLAIAVNHATEYDNLTEEPTPEKISLATDNV